MRIGSRYLKRGTKLHTHITAICKITRLRAIRSLAGGQRNAFVGIRHHKRTI